MNSLALLIDSDNGLLGYTKHIIQFCEVFGSLGIKNAYGDWQQPPLDDYRQKITDLGVNCVQQNRVGTNATDMRLAADVHSMLDKSEADIYLIVSRDGDFTAVCGWIHEKGAKIVGIGSEKGTSSTLRKACDLFFDVEEIVKKLSDPAAEMLTTPKAKIKATPAPKAAPKVKAAPAPKAASKPKVKVVPVTKAKAAPKANIVPVPKATPADAARLKLLIKAYQNTPQKDGWVFLSQLKEAVRQLDQQFEERFVKKPSSWFKPFSHKFEVVGGRVRMK